MVTKRRRIAVLAIVAFLGLAPFPAAFSQTSLEPDGSPGAAFAAEKPFVEQVRKDTEWFSGFSTRVVGSLEHDQARAELLAKVKAVPGVRIWTQDFPVVAPKVLEANLTIKDGPLAGTQHRVFPVWPALSRLSTTPPEGISGRLVYIRAISRRRASKARSP